MLRRLVLGVTGRPSIRRLMTGGAGRRVAKRFVAGEELDDALDVTKALNGRGMSVSLDHLGENVADAAAANEAARVYLDGIDRIAAAGLDANVSVKLTQMGLDLDPDLAAGNAALVAARAAEARTTVTLDMEDHSYTDQTVAICLRLADRYPGAVGVAVQSYLYRTPDDLRSLVSARVPVRLCKGAYREPASVAHQKKADVDAAYAQLLRTLIESDSYPMIATHDERLVRFAIRQVERIGRPRDSFEFQMLYGVRRELQQRLVDDGYRLRIYLPFGTEWYPYLTRRLAERPANLRFFLESLVRG